jgi:hypothetical protein
MNLKLLTAAAVLSTAIAAPAFAQQDMSRAQVVRHHKESAAVIEHRDSANGFACQPGTTFRGEDGRMHLCQ